MVLVSTEEAARQLGVNPVHVRRLVRDGELPAQKIGARWLIDDEALRRRERIEPSPGRPLSSEMAWMILQLADGAVRAEAKAGTEHPVIAATLEAINDRRLRFRVRRAIADAPSVMRWSSWLRRRAQPQRIWVHPGVLGRLSADERLHAGGAAAVAAAGVGVSKGIGGDEVFYVNPGDLETVIADFRGRADANGQVLLMVLPEHLPPGVALGPGQPAGPAVGLVDLLSSPDARERHVAARRLANALQLMVQS